MPKDTGVFGPPDAHYHAFQITRDHLRELADVITLLEMRLAIKEVAAFAVH